MTTMGGAFGSLEVSQNTVASAAPYAQEVRDADSYADVVGAATAAGIDMLVSGQAPGGLGPVITQVSSAGGMFLIGGALANLIAPRIEKYTKFTDPMALKLQRAAITAGASLLVYQLSGFPQYSLVAFGREAAASLAADYAFDMMMREQ